MRLSTSVVLLATVVLACGFVRPGAAADARVEYLGNPCGAKYPAGEWVYARNVWDVQAHGGLLYFGCGNGSNLPPARNAKGGEIRNRTLRRPRFQVRQ